jgi:hydrogenase maturation protease
MSLSDASASTGDDFALVIGYGSTLRSDDSVGQRAAEAVAAWERPGVETLAVHILGPDLAERIARSRLTVFIDARVDDIEKGVVVRALEPGEGNKAMFHQADPSQLLTLARVVFGACPPAWMVTIPAVETGIGESLSPTTERELGNALLEIARLLDEPVGVSSPASRG